MYKQFYIACTSAHILSYNRNMFKIIGVVLLIGGGFIFFNQDKIEEYKQRIVETVNPAAKEERLLSELETSLGELSEKLSVSEKQKVSTVLSKTQSTLQALKEINKKGDLVANLSNLVQKIVPFESEPFPTWLPPGQVCPTP